MLKERFHNRKISKLEGFVWKTMQAWLGGKSCFPHTNAPNFGGRCNRYFWDIRLKILGLGNFNVPFQLVLTKLNCFRVYRKLIAWSSHEKSLLWLNKSMAWSDSHRQTALDIQWQMKDQENQHSISCIPRSWRCRWERIRRERKTKETDYSMNNQIGP